MPVQIGIGAHDFSHPTGLLSDCHRRIEMFLNALDAVGNVSDHPATEETRRVLTSALRYFRESAPKHTADEEESLFPRLRQVHDAEAQSALQKLDQLVKDHEAADVLHAEVERLGQLYLSQGSLSSADAADFGKAVASLQALYGPHISIEDQMIFPVAARVLRESDQAAIGEEMAARRRIRPTTEIASSTGRLKPF
ncbi:MAG: hemerythrin domain-containing protein [Candidatus Acidiferrales bacterium]